LLGRVPARPPGATTRLITLVGVSLPSRRVLAISAVLVVVLAATVVTLYRIRPEVHPAPGCIASAAAEGTSPDEVIDYPMTPEQADNAATISSVGTTMGMSRRAITVALATALQESGLHNLADGDRDSVGLFQQRPSQGWGSVAQIGDPVYASRAFYRRLDAVRNWTALDVNDAAQTVQRSAVPDAYGQWEGQAGALAAALTGAPGASFTCHDLTVGMPQSVLVSAAKQELGTAALSGAQPGRRGRQIGNWLVAHALRFGIDRVTVNGSTWTPSSGTWQPTGPSDGRLSLHQVGSPSS
jgi:hypothetical protein